MWSTPIRTQNERQDDPKKAKGQKGADQLKIKSKEAKGQKRADPIKEKQDLNKLNHEKEEDVLEEYLDITFRSIL